jgi:hypothetical protein
VRRMPMYRPHGVRCREGMNPVRALMRNLRNWQAMIRENVQAGATREAEIPMRLPVADHPVVATMHL